MFDWCRINDHDGCNAKYQKFYIGNKKVKRKTVTGVIWLDEWIECDCTCHGNEPVKKTTRKRRKK